MTYEEGETLAHENGLLFLETSAKTAYNVKEAVDLSAQAILRDVDSNIIDMNNDPNVIYSLLQIYTLFRDLN